MKLPWKILFIFLLNIWNEPLRESHMKLDPSNFVLGEVFKLKRIFNKSHTNNSMPPLVKHSPTGSNHLKNFNNSFSKEVQKGLLYPHFDFLIPVVFYVFDSLIPSIFQNRSCCNFFIRFDTVKFRGAFRTQSNICGRTFRKSSQQFFNC